MSQAAQLAHTNSDAIVIHGGIVLSTSPSLQPSNITSQSWLLDSGATRHITCSLSGFEVSKWLSNSFVTLPDNSQIPVHAVGSVTFNSDFSLQNVLYVPTFHVNLISVSALLSHTSLDISFNSHGFLIQDHSLSKVIGKGDLFNGLYVYKHPASSLQESVSIIHNSHHLSTLPVVPISVVNKCSDSGFVNTKLWHSRLGHASVKILDHLSNKIPFACVDSKCVSTCDICPLSKQKRLSFFFQ